MQSVYHTFASAEQNRHNRIHIEIRIIVTVYIKLMNYYTNAELSHVCRHLCCHITVASFLPVCHVTVDSYVTVDARVTVPTYVSRVLRHRLHHYRRLRQCRFLRHLHHLHHCRHSRHCRVICRCTVLHHRRQFLRSSLSMSSSPLTPLSFLTPQSLLHQCRFLGHPGHLITLTSVDSSLKP